MNVLRVVIVGVGLCAVLSSVDTSEASCNLIPGPKLSGSPPTSNRALSTKSEDLQFPFKGALGRIDRVDLLPGRTRAYAVLPDGTCAAAGKPAAVSAAKVDTIGPIAAAMFSVESRPRARVYGAETHAALTSASASIEFELLPGHEAESAPLLVAAANGSRPIILTVPAQSPVRAKSDASLRPSVRIVVAKRPEKAAELARLFNKVATEGCEATCAEFVANGGLVCVDRVLALVQTEKGAVFKHDEMPCNVSAPDPLPVIDFVEQCEDGRGGGGGLPRCDNHPTQLPFWIDDCSGAHFAFDWTGIRKGDVDRYVAGTTGASRKASKNDAIALPGPEFVGSTPHDDPDQRLPDTDWRKPNITVWTAPDSTTEFGLRGVVDEPNSIVHIYGRVPVEKACAGTTEACFGLDRKADGTIETCACADRQPTPCTCEPLRPPGRRYFACDGGPFAKRPCTRANHCGTDGGRTVACAATSRCYREGSVWGEQPEPVPGDPCVDDDDCERTPARPQCGLLLFDLRNRDPQLHADAVNSWRGERGACRPGMQACSKGGTNRPPRCREGTCRGYVLEGQEKFVP